MQKPLPNRSNVCVDMKCFYASCIAMLEGLNVMKMTIAVITNFQTWQCCARCIATDEGAISY